MLEMGNTKVKVLVSDENAFDIERDVEEPISDTTSRDSYDISDRILRWEEKGGNDDKYALSAAQSENVQKLDEAALKTCVICFDVVDEPESTCKFQCGHK